jgi:hypothetical protein
LAAAGNYPNEVNMEKVGAQRFIGFGLLACALSLALACRKDVPAPPDPGVDIGVAKPDAGGDVNIDPIKVDVATDTAGTADPSDGAAADAPVVLDAETGGASDVPAAGDATVDQTPAGPDVAAPCGGPGQPCCGGTSCRDNGCCATASGGVARCVANGSACRTSDDESAGMCSNGKCAGCGSALNQPCCQGNVCSGAGLTCNDDRCAACGGPNQACCPNRTCSADSCCVRQGGDDVCIRAGETCPLQGPGNGGTCAANRCSGCGGANQPCCNGGLCSEAGQACVSGRCSSCGGLNQPACPGNACNNPGCVSGAAVCVAPGMDCGQGTGTCNADGSCRQGGDACGGLNQPCCGLGAPPAGAFCSRPGTTCTLPGQGMGLGRHCVLCGGFDQPCCDDDDCHQGTCSNSGPGQRMCRRF